MKLLCRLINKKYLMESGSFPERCDHFDNVLESEVIHDFKSQILSLNYNYFTWSWVSWWPNLYYIIEGWQGAPAGTIE